MPSPPFRGPDPRTRAEKSSRAPPYRGNNGSCREAPQIGGISVPNRSLRHELADIQRRLRRLAAQNDRMHEWLALKIHQDAVAEQTVSRASRTRGSALRRAS